MHKFLNALIILLIAATSWSCKASFSFTGASISPDVKTVSIAFFPSNASLAPPNASQAFTEALKDVFLSQTNLVLVQEDGDLEFEGFISNYTADPVAIQGNETAALTRVTMTVNVTFINNKDESQSFESTFSRFEDFESSTDLTAVENELLTNINTQLTQDIFNKAVTNW